MTLNEKSLSLSLSLSLSHLTISPLLHKFDMKSAERRQKSNMYEINTMLFKFRLRLQRLDTGQTKLFLG